MYFESDLKLLTSRVSQFIFFFFLVLLVTYSLFIYFSDIYNEGGGNQRGKCISEGQKINKMPKMADFCPDGGGMGK